MNSLFGENWKISKKLKDSDEPIICESKRSVYATTYIPKDLTNIIAEKGILAKRIAD